MEKDKKQVFFKLTTKLWIIILLSCITKPVSAEDAQTTSNDDMTNYQHKITNILFNTRNGNSNATKEQYEQENKLIKTFGDEENKTETDAHNDDNNFLNDVKNSIQQGENINARDKNGMTLLDSAITNNNQEAVKLLIEAGADINATANTGLTPLMRASSQPDIVRLLIDAKANLNVKDNTYGKTALMYAAGSVNTETLKLLLDAGADINATSNEGWTALCYAVLARLTDTIKLLIDAGVDVNLGNKTPLSIATSNKNTEAIELLKQAGANE